MSKRLSLLLISGFWLLSLQAWGQLTVPPPQIYITTLNGNQVEAVDANGTIALTTPIYTDHSTTEDFPNFLPEGIALGQDGKLYVANTQNNKILRMNQDGSQVETIYDQLICGDGCPVSPEGPALDANGNLFFNTASGHTGVWEIAGVTSIGFGGPFPAPTNVVGVFCSEVCTTMGEGLAFGGTFPIIGRLNSPAVKERKRPTTDAFKSAFPTIGGLLAFTGSLRGLLFPAVAAPALPANDANLLIVDNSNDQILIFNGTNEAVLIDNTQNCNDSLCLDGPIGIAVAPAANAADNIAAGDIFVANTGESTRNVNQFDSAGNFKGTIANSFTPNCDCGNSSPIFLAIDPLGNLFVTTAGDTSTGSLGNVWEVTSSIVDSELVVAENDLTQNGSNTVFAWGIALAETTLPLNPGGGTNIYNFGPFNFKVQYSADPNFTNEFLTVEALLTTQDQLTAQTNGGAFAGEQIVVYDGADGNGVTFVLVCQAFPNGPAFPPDPCAQVPEGYEVFTSYNSVPANFIPSNPNFLKKELGAGIYDSSPPAPPGDGDILTNFFVTRIDPTGAGRTKPGFSDFILGNLPPSPKTAATFGGFLPPLAPKNGRVFNSGDTLAVKFTLKPTSPAMFDPTKVVARISVEMTSMPTGTPAANFKAIPSNLFLLRKGTFQFYLDLTGYAPGGYTLIVTSNSFPTTTVNFTVQ